MTLNRATSLTTLLLLSLSFLATLVNAQNGQVCPLCATAADLPRRWDIAVPGDGRTCRDIYLYLGDMSPNNALCQATKDKAQTICCGAEDPNIDYPPTNPPVYTGPVGNEPTCPICGTMEYPGIPNAFIVARYVGEYTCDQLYGRGLNGMTPDFMCGPLQDFAAPVCGCGQFNPRCRENSNNCWGNPGAPVASPVSRPVAAPTQVTSPTVQQPVSSPVNVQPTIFNRKTPPQGGKYSTKLSDGRGGSASVLRGGRRGEESELPDDFDEDLPETPEGLEFDFRVVEKDEQDSSH